MPCAALTPLFRYTMDLSTASLSFSGSDEGVHPVYLALCWNRAGLGIAVYDAETQVIEVGECKEFDSFFTVAELKEEIVPCCIVIPNGSDTRFVEAVKSPLEKGFTPEVMQLGQAEFSPDATLSKVMHALGFESVSECKKYLTEVYDMGNVQITRTLGGLISGITSLGRVKAIRLRVFAHSLSIDANTIEALQIFKIVAHPSSHHGIGSSKEGLSLFGLLNLCKTKMGSEVLRRWMKTPTTKLATIEERLCTIDIFLAPHNQDLIASLRDHLRFVKDPRDLVKKFKEYKNTVQHWQTLFQLVYAYPIVVSICSKLGEHGRSPVFERVVDSFHEGPVSELFREMHRTIDLPMSHRGGRVVIKWGVDPELDRHKEAYEGLGGFLETVAQSVVKEMGTFSYPVSVDYYPQLGYFTTVGIAFFNERFTTDLPDAGYEFQFKSSEKLFYKSSRMRELDERYGDIYSAITDMEANVAMRLTELVLQEDKIEALMAVKHIASVDCLCALALVAKEDRWSRPSVVKENVLHVIDARHPLQEKTVDRFVPNDIIVSKDEKRLSIVTGPNSSGKSIYLKQVAIVVLLAHIGSYVPAKEAVVGLTDRVFTRIRSKHCLPGDGPSSAFASDLADINNMLRYATARSLLIIDEFGKGTVAADGIALLAAVLVHFMNKGSDCPKVFVSTHYLEVLEKGLVDVNNALLDVSHMAVDIDIKDANELIFRYKRQPACAQESHAIYCSEKAGVPCEVLTRARYILTLLKKGVATSVFRRLLLATPNVTTYHKSVLKLISNTDLTTCCVSDLCAKVKALR
eukprot:TRINITY_DN15560_c0_g1_i2.p1 TRINITY_DN15560_c0_g1~~TRINITY_DN15560_c0_g1_i2.p1  ORF type:complete len:801 (+),score=175.12 TRINITY_DN15560_c0_g1_i2:1346-3748(+)